MRVCLQIATVALAGTVFFGGAAAAAPRASGAGRGVPASEVARLEAEIRDQRDLLIQAMQLEQQHYDLLLKLIQSGSGNRPGPAANAATTANPTEAGPADASTHPLLLPSAAGSIGAATEPAPRKAPAPTASITGKVSLSSGKVGDDVFVYVQNVRGPAARGRTFEIAQRDKQFIPAVAVVQRGTRVTFPNFDAIYHNVFSSGPPHAFDLGSYRAGDTPRAVEMSASGVVELYCNMHSKMHASLLVVPSALWTRVGADGSFRIDNVPVGSRKLVAWSPRARPVEQSVDVGPGGASASFNLSSDGDRPHNNKFGMPYGSYKE